MFGAQSGNFVRLNFATSEEILSEAISRMAGSVK
jgi:bifunctional pyridoxal-dependent enzyme with beta-cystathionase and maltose regulon repressor activities